VDETAAGGPVLSPWRRTHIDADRVALGAAQPPPARRRRDPIGELHQSFELLGSELGADAESSVLVCSGRVMRASQKRRPTEAELWEQLEALPAHLKGEIIGGELHVQPRPRPARVIQRLGSKGG
jgi:hypothetical protein